METLLKIQNELKVPKGNYNSFGKYKYRSTEDILEAVKPILLANKATLILSDDIVQIGSKAFLKATASLFIGENTISTFGYAETSEHKGMSSEQTTGTASSYARKYALNGLFLIDETEADPDNNEFKKAEEQAKKLELENLQKQQNANDILLNNIENVESLGILFKSFSKDEQQRTKKRVTEIKLELENKLNK